MHKHKQHKISQFLVVFLGLTLTVWVIVVFEIISQKIVKQQELARSPVFVADSKLGFRLRPNTVVTHQAYGPNTPKTVIVTTSQGFRDNHLYQIPTPPNTFRILMLGDSFIEGDGVDLDSTISKQLERLIKPIISENIEVINAGWRGSHPTQQYLWLLNEGMQYAPDIVVVNFYVGNDVDDLNQFTMETDATGLATKLTLSQQYVDELGYLRKRPDLRRVQGPLGQLNYKICDPLYICKYYLRPQADKALTKFGYGKYFPIWSQDWFGFIWPQLSPQITTNWEIQQLHLKAIKKLVSQNNGTLIITAIPFELQVDKYKWSQKATKVMSTSELEAMYQGQYPQERIKQFTNSEGIIYVDFLPFLRQSPVPTYFKYDMHWNNSGHLLASHALFESLLYHRLLPSK